MVGVEAREFSKTDGRPPNPEENPRPPKRTKEDITSAGPYNIIKYFSQHYKIFAFFLFRFELNLLISA